MRNYSPFLAFLCFSIFHVTLGGSYDFAIDVYSYISKSNFQCLQQSGYKVAFINVYYAFNGGHLNDNGVGNIRNALDANLGVELLAQPDAKYASGSSQFKELDNHLKSNNINYKTIWIQVTAPNYWYADVNENIRFLTEFINSAKNKGLQIGIYTNWYDWMLITGDYNANSLGNIMLWYWNTLGVGENAETNADFGDFRKFGRFNSPAIKQFAMREKICTVMLGRSVYQNTKSRTYNNLTSNNQKETNKPFAQNSPEVISDELPLADSSNNQTEIILVGNNFI